MRHLRKFTCGVALAAATITLPVMLPAVAGAAPATYTVAAGDTLVGIASGHGVPLDALLVVNGLQLESVIHPGETLTIPDTDAIVSDSGSTSQGLTYQVAAGDTLSGIATNHRVTLQALLSVNGLTVSSLIQPGQVLRLPDGAVGGRSGQGGGGAVSTAKPGSPVQTVVDYALAQVGKEYVFFTKGPAVFDCSGLTLAAYAQVGVEMVHYSGTQAQMGTGVDFWNESIKAGDMIFLDGDWNGEIDHVGLATSATTWVQASLTEGAVVTGNIPSDSVIISVRRIFNG